MFFLILALIFLVPSAIWWWKYKSDTSVDAYKRPCASDKCVASWITLICSLCFFFIFVVIVNAVGYTNQINDIEQIEKIEANKVIFEVRANDLTERLSVLLETKYPEHERAIFENLTPDNAELVFVAYPQLRAIEGFTKLADQIKGLRDKIYAQDVKITEHEKEIRVRDRSIFLLTWLLPSE